MKSMCLVLVGVSLFWSADPAFAANLKDDVMVPMGRAVAFVSRFKADPARAAEVAAQAAKIPAIVELGLTLEPSTVSYAKLGDEIGAENARRKYLGLMETLRGSSLQLATRAAAVPAGGVCADACGAIVDEMRSVEELGHSIFDGE